MAIGATGATCCACPVFPNPITGALEKSSCDDTRGALEKSSCETGALEKRSCDTGAGT